MEGAVQAETKKPKPSEPAIIRRNTEKISKLPIISKEIQEKKVETRKLIASSKHGDYSKSSKIV